MFDNIGAKIKRLAKILCWVGIAASFILAIIMFVSAEEGSYSTECTEDLAWPFCLLVRWLLGSHHSLSMALVN